MSINKLTFQLDQSQQFGISYILMDISVLLYKRNVKKLHFRRNSAHHFHGPSPRYHDRKDKHTIPNLWSDLTRCPPPFSQHLDGGKYISPTLDTEHIAHVLTLNIALLALLQFNPTYIPPGQPTYTTSHTVTHIIHQPFQVNDAQHGTTLDNQHLKPPHVSPGYVQSYGLNILAKLPFTGITNHNPHIGCFIFFYKLPPPTPSLSPWPPSLASMTHQLSKSCTALFPQLCHFTGSNSALLSGPTLSAYHRPLGPPAIMLNKSLAWTYDGSSIKQPCPTAQRQGQEHRSPLPYDQNQHSLRLKRAKHHRECSHSSGYQ